MKLEPVRRYGLPSYPTREWVEQHPEMLRQLPARWRTNPFVLAVLAAAPALGCTSKPSPGGSDGGPVSSTATARPTGSGVVAKRDPLAKVAPVFEHGGGVAASGGVAATRIVFISEDEAVRIIRDEAAKAGLDFAPTGKTIDGVPLPSTSNYDTFAERARASAHPGSGPVEPMSHVGKLELDGTDAVHKVSFEFVSRKDFDAWKGPERGESSLTTYDLAGTARALRDGLDQAAPAGTYAVFYDPLPKFRPPAAPPGKPPVAAGGPGANDEEPTLEQSREELRAQVRDFVAWLKAQGAL